MADASEDSIRAPQNSEDHDPEEEVQDFRFLLQKKLPSRGVKDFEPNDTNLQQNTLEASRQAMHDVLSSTRYHGPDKSNGVYDEEGNGAWLLEAKGVWMKGVGRVKVVPGRMVEVKDGQGNIKEEPLRRLWLLPEETLWLLERASLHMRWPAEAHQNEDEGLPMSLQGAYAAYIGREEDKEGGLTLEQFSVYQYLKRCGYIVLRAKDNLHNVPRPTGTAHSAGQEEVSTYLTNIWRWLFKASSNDVKTRSQLGPLVKPGLYRSYDHIFRQMLLVPFHDPRSRSAITTPTSQPSSGLTITWHVYKTTPAYKKTAPGPPDFYISVVSARDSVFPTDIELDALLQQTPYHAPGKGDGLGKKLRGGYRNVILAVVDQGVTSFIDVADVGFGCEKLWERDSKARGAGGSKRGGFGRGRGRGRGR